MIPMSMRKTHPPLFPPSLPFTREGGQGVGFIEWVKSLNWC